MILCNCLYCDNCQNNVQVLTTESIFSESASQIKALVRNLSAFSTLFSPGKSWDNVRSTAAPYTESRLARLVRNKRVGFPVVEHYFCSTERNSKLFSLPRKCSERNSESFLFRGTAGIPSEITICSVYSVFRGIIFLYEISNPNQEVTKRCRLHILAYQQPPRI